MNRYLMDKSKKVLLALSALAALGWIAPSVAAGSFPTRPITLVVPFSPGGNLDLVARLLAPSLQHILGKSVLIDNRTGAGGAIGASYVARSDPDGQTLLVTSPNALVVLPLMNKTNYSLSDFESVGELASTPLAVLVKGGSRFKTIAELLAAARANPGKLAVGHGGPGTTDHLGVLQLEDAAKVDLNLIAYRGSAPALTALMGGQLDLVVGQLNGASTYLPSGQLVVLAVMSAKRDPSLPNVPTLREAGLKDFEANTTSGILAPAKTPASTIAILNSAIAKALDDPALRQRFVALGSPAANGTPASWLQLLKREGAKAQILAREGKLHSE